MQRGWLAGCLAWALLGCQTRAPDTSPPAPDATTAQPQPAAQPHPTAQPDPSAAASPEAPTTSIPHLPNRRALRLATWNVQWLTAGPGRGPIRRNADDFAELARMVERLNADVIAVQEVDGPAAAHRIFPPTLYEVHIPDHPGAQDVGFVVRRGLEVRTMPSVLALDVGGLRPGVDIELTLGSQPLRLLAVHLKSGCFSGALDRNAACQKLSAQIAPLEAWIDARQQQGVPFAVLGDFNRQFFASSRDGFWQELDDGDPKGLTLWSPTQGQKSTCWGGRHPEFVDHLVLSAALRELTPEPHFQELSFGPGADARRTSDHCPLSIDVSVEVTTTHRAPPLALPSAVPSPAAVPPDSASAPVTPTPTLDEPSSAGAIKGNISRRGKKLYHLPHCPSYAETVIEAHRGERWFATEEQARAAGWAKAGNCR